MPGDSGLAVLDAVARETTVVFVTAHPEYAVDAFEAGAIDYLLEPVDPERLEQSVAQWQADLPSAAFVRLSRSLIVNVTRLEKTQWRSRDEKLLTFLGRDDTIVIGRLAASRLREILGGRPPPDANAGGHA
jgi:DNA-binding LytR/AlgR family response regulator